MYVYLSVASIIETPTSFESSSAVSEECSFTYIYKIIMCVYMSLCVWRGGGGG